MSDLLQILKGTSARPRVTFYSGGSPQNLDSGVPTVTITRPDGTTIASGTVSAVGGETGTYEFTLSSANTATETYLTVTWAGPIGGITQTLTTFVEVLGGLLFTLPDLRTLSIGGDTPFSSTTTWPDARLMEARAATLQEFEQILGFAPVPRFYRRTFDGSGGYALGLPGLFASAVRSVTVNGVAQSTSGYAVTDANELVAVSNYGAGTAFTKGWRNVVVEWVAGWQRVMGDGSNVAMLRAAMRLQPGISSTATSVTTPDGVSYTFDAAGQVTQAGTVRHFGVPALDSWLNRWSQAGLAVA